MTAEKPRLRILIVENEAAICMELEMRVTDLGHIAVGTAANFARALSLAEQHRPHLALMDINLSGPRNGLEAAAKLRERYDIPVIFMTAYSNPEMVERAQATRPVGWLVKPFGDSELQLMIELFMRRDR